MKYMVERVRAHVGYVTSNAMTLVHTAVLSGSLDMVKFVVRNTPIPMHLAVSSDGTSVLHIAAGELKYHNLIIAAVNRETVNLDAQHASEVLL